MKRKGKSRRRRRKGGGEGGREEGTKKFKYMKSCCQIRIKNENASIWKMGKMGKGAIKREVAGRGERRGERRAEGAG